MPTQQIYSIGQAALAKVIHAVLEARGLSWVEAEYPDLLQQFEQQGAKAVIDAVAAHDAAKGVA